MTMAQWHALAAVETPRKRGGEMPVAEALSRFGQRANGG